MQKLCLLICSESQCKKNCTLIYAYKGFGLYLTVSVMHGCDLIKLKHHSIMQYFTVLNIITVCEANFILIVKPMIILTMPMARNLHFSKLY